MVIVRVALLALCATGCDYVTSSFRTNGFSGDPYPIITETHSGAIIVSIQEAGSTSMHDAVLDVLTPITLIDRGTERQPEFNTRTYTLFGSLAPGEPLTLPRARFSERKVATLHPCRLDTDTIPNVVEPANRPY